MSHESPKSEPEANAHCSACVNGIEGPDAALQQEERPAARRGLSLDSWAVLLALAAAALVKLHILNSVKW
jgi:hypothetical protein